MSRKPLSAEELELMRKLQREGLGPPAIAKAVGRSRQFVWEALTGRAVVGVAERDDEPSKARRRDRSAAAGAHGGAKTSEARATANSLRPAGLKAKSGTPEWYLDGDARWRAAVGELGPGALAPVWPRRHTDIAINGQRDSAVPVSSGLATANQGALSSDAGGT